MRLAEIVRALEEIAPTSAAESWDNVGLLVGDPSEEISRVLLAIDYVKAVADEAHAFGAQLVVAYHPPIFSGLKSVRAGSLVFDAIRRGVALYSHHTALDVADGGTNDVLADALGLVARTPLKLGTPPEKKGIGRVGVLEPPLARADAIARIKERLGLAHVLVAGPTEGTVGKAAVCAGACGELLDDALAHKVDLYLTGELRHHDAIKAASKGVTVVATLHSNSERKVLPRLRERLLALCPGLDVRVSERDRDAFTIS